MSMLSVTVGYVELLLRFDPTWNSSGARDNSIGAGDNSIGAGDNNVLPNCQLLVQEATRSWVRLLSS